MGSIDYVLQKALYISIDLIADLKTAISNKKKLKYQNEKDR